ncbi:bifunctional 4-hydroxy-2-oxoglutarate aldolase/2-dehydro-3-deoxy-phosphogluconate aldolase [Spirulina major]|uniref:bifunctional 4-hydroxy-2-oxoglutarate aldolase/2-dehydro-3-deoxy-phosphogluconate aldolase n=1 Tax=Spirulina major TaxID=270636 RepID=UPI0009332C29|nr:bifunctional 4-hydroxy-2-oxoglutarate aldolase/2-dehydro-3-deoxy-phosphogluconate aldolase [Spirulina major]
MGIDFDSVGIEPSAAVVRWRDRLRAERAIAVIRAPDYHIGIAMAEAVIAGGVGMVEITWQSDRAAELITHLRAAFPHCCIGTGTILTPEHLHTAHQAGAEFVFSPHSDRTLIDHAQTLDLPIIPGALTPTEILQAWQWGAACVKVFPVQAVGGVDYFRAIRTPVCEPLLIPTGGVTLANLTDFLAAGAIAVGLAGDLFPKVALNAQDWPAITQRAQKLRSLLTQWQHQNPENPSL